MTHALVFGNIHLTKGTCEVDYYWVSHPFFVPFTPDLYADFDLLLPFTELIHAHSLFNQALFTYSVYLLRKNTIGKK